MIRCVRCGGEAHAGYARDVYTRRGVDVEVAVTGIPAAICDSCGESYVDLGTLQEVEQLVLPLFDAARKLVHLSAPKITMEFPVAQPVNVPP